MSTPPARERYQIVVEAMPDDVPAAVGVRALLKHALRRLRLRCLDARVAAGGRAAGAPGVAQDAMRGAGQAVGPPAADGTPQGPAGGPGP
jgi:hypothetical protein